MRGVSNAAVGGVLAAFCAAVYGYSMHAVGQDNLDVALEQRVMKAEEQGKPAAQGSGAKPAASSSRRT
jgi:hypothetical protein